MDTKILLLVMLGISLLVFGCAKKAPEAPAEVAAEEEPPAEEPAAGPEEAEPEEPAEVSEDMQKLADLFSVDTDKPLEDEGLDVETPAAKEE